MPNATPEKINLGKTLLAGCGQVVAVVQPDVIPALLSPGGWQRIHMVMELIRIKNRKRPCS